VRRKKDTPMMQRLERRAVRKKKDAPMNAAIERRAVRKKKDATDAASPSRAPGAGSLTGG
jgi:hypothetical protein